MNLCLRPSLQKVQVSENNSSNKTAREASIEANNFVKNVFNNEHCLQELFQNVLLILNNFATIVNNFFLYSKKFLKCTKQFPKQLNNYENNLTIYQRFFLAFPPQLFLNPFNNCMSCPKVHPKMDPNSMHFSIASGSSDAPKDSIGCLDVATVSVHQWLQSA